MQWHPAGENAGTFAILRVGGHGGISVLNRMHQGEVGALHTHDTDEELIVVTGTVRLGNTLLGPGDYHCIPAGTPHQPIAESDCLFATILHDRTT